MKDNIERFLDIDGKSHNILLKEYMENRLLSLQAGLYILKTEHPTLIKEFQFKDLKSDLSKLPTPLLSVVLKCPFTSYWITACNKLINNEKSENQDFIIKHLYEWNRLYLSLMIEQNQSVLIDVTLNNKAFLCLPISALVIQLPSHWSNQIITCEYKSETKQLILYYDQEKQEIILNESEEQVFEISKAHNFLEINNFEYFYRIPKEINYEYEPLHLNNSNAWEIELERSLSLIEDINPSLYSEIRDIISVVIPVVSDHQDVHLSSSFAAIMGSFYLSYTQDPVVLSEAIVHEYYHNKLNLIFMLDEIVLNKNDGNIFYSPWRRDLRPITGLLHGCFAFYGVVSYWYRCLETGYTGSFVNRTKIVNRVKILINQLQSVIDILRKNGVFTQEGNDFMEKLANNIEHIESNMR